MSSTDSTVSLFNFLKISFDRVITKIYFDITITEDYLLIFNSTYMDLCITKLPDSMA